MAETVAESSPPLRAAVVYGAPTPPRRLGALAAAAQGALERAGIPTAFIDLSAARPADGDEAGASDAYREGLARVAESDLVLLCSPVYRASVPATLKGFLEHLDPAALAAKPVGVLSMGSSPAHALAIPAALAPILEWFGAISVPGPLYFTDDDFTDGEPSPAARERLEAFVALAGFLAGQARGCPTPAAVGPSLR